jgi:hypothetical protein
MTRHSGARRPVVIALGGPAQFSSKRLTEPEAPGCGTAASGDISTLTATVPLLVPYCSVLYISHPGAPNKGIT